MKLLSPPKLISTELHPSNILFLAAKGDHISPHTEIQKNADQLGTDIKIYEGLSHTYQAESSWTDIADDMLQWLHQSNVKDHQVSAKTSFKLVIACYTAIYYFSRKPVGFDWNPEHRCFLT